MYFSNLYYKVAIHWALNNLIVVNHVQNVWPSPIFAHGWIRRILHILTNANKAYLEIDLCLTLIEYQIFRLVYYSTIGTFLHWMNIMSHIQCVVLNVKPGFRHSNNHSIGVSYILYIWSGDMAWDDGCIPLHLNPSICFMQAHIMFNRIKILSIIKKIMLI